MGITEDKKIVQDIADKIKKERIKRNLLQSEVAKKAGISSNYYAKVERAEARPSGLTITKICRALGIKSTELLPV